MTGEFIEHYRVLERLGDGGMGTVFRALDTMLEREVALKVLRTELSDQPEVTQRFRAEAVTLARLSHPHIATLFGLLRHGSQLCMVMEYVPGRTLAALLRDEPILPWERAVRLTAQILTALDYAHGAGVVHRDIKPSNVVVSAAGVVKVLDFGIARVLSADRLTRQGFIVGTPQYMAPEQIRGTDLDGRADVYSAGVLLYEMLSGRLPFRADSDIALMYAHLEGQAEPLARVAPGVPSWLCDVVGRALARDPAERLASAAAFRAALDAQAAPPPTGAGAPSLAGSEAPTIVPAPADRGTPEPRAAIVQPAVRPDGGLAARLALLRTWLVPRVTWEYFAGPDGLLTVRRAFRARTGPQARPRVEIATPEPAPTVAAPASATTPARAIAAEAAHPTRRRSLMVGGLVGCLLAAAAVIWLRTGDGAAPPAPPTAVAAVATPATPMPPAAPEDAVPVPPGPGVDRAAAAIPAAGAAVASPREKPLAGVSSSAASAAAPAASTPPSSAGAPPATRLDPAVPGGGAAAAAAVAAVPTPAPGPPDVSAPARFVPPANLRNETFEEITLLVPGRQRGYDEVEVSITFERERLVVVDTDEDRAVAAVQYVGDGSQTSVAGPATLLVGSEHWFILPTTTGRIILQLDERTAKSVVAAFEARTGLSVARSRGEIGG